MFSQARFVVVTRHPLAVAMSHKRWPCCGNMQLGTLIMHWIKQHQLMQADAPKVRQFMWLRYEELAELKSIDLPTYRDMRTSSTGQSPSERKERNLLRTI